MTTDNNNKETTNENDMIIDIKPEYDIAKVYNVIGKSTLGEHLQTLSDYKHYYQSSINDIHSFWNEQAKQRIDWFHPYTTVHGGSLDNGNIYWYPNGKCNVSYNCIDRHVNAGNGNHNAILFEGDEPNDIKHITYNELLIKVCQISNTLLSLNVKKGDVITIYMPMIPELPMTMLACTRIGAIHSVVFAGFSSEALATRVAASKSKIIITADIGKRGGKTIHLKDIVNECRTKHNVEHIVEHVLVWERFITNDDIQNVLSFDNTNNEALSEMNNTNTNNNILQPKHYIMKEKDIRMDILVAVQRPYCVPEWMDSEDPLFILYTSGSTGKPKGLVHTTGGYIVYASYTTETTFNICPNDIFACVADCGWITGHTYVVYGPLLNGITTFVFESTPVYPNAGRYWDMISRHQITQFYTAPTAIRLLMKFGDTIPSQYDITSSCRILGTVGEPINPEAWRWYYEVIGKQKCTIVDTYWQTETGGHIITNLPGITPMKPGSCTLPLPGIEPIILDPITGLEVTETDSNGNISGVLALKQPWPGMARTCLHDHQRYLQTYLHVYKGYYYTGDSVIRDKDGCYFIIGRVDDVLNVSGHRIGTAEVESALVAHAAIAQAAVVGQPHDIKGTSIVAFVMLKDGYEYCMDDQLLILELKQLVRNEIGSFATPDMIVCSPSLPMTRSGKIMRRILRKIVSYETDTLGDISTLADPSIVDILIQKVHDYHTMHEK